MSNATKSSALSPVFMLSIKAARKICETHGYKTAAQSEVDGLPNRTELSKANVASMIELQLSRAAEDLNRCVERAGERAGKVEELPRRAKQGAALREIKAALESLRDAVERNWDLVKPLIEVDTAEQLGHLLATEATKELLPPELLSEYIESSDNKGEYHLQQLKLSYLFRAGSRPLTRLIKGAKVVVRRAERSIAPGAPLKDPFGLALVIQLAQHYEGHFDRKASWSDNGPFSKFCAAVFEAIGLNTKDSWEYMIRKGAELHRSSFGWRRWHEPRGDASDDGLPASNRNRRTRGHKTAKTRKRILIPKT